MKPPHGPPGSVVRGWQRPMRSGPGDGDGLGDWNVAVVDSEYDSMVMLASKMKEVGCSQSVCVSVSVIVSDVDVSLPSCQF
jgi:hypothetical protein